MLLLNSINNILGGGGEVENLNRFSESLFLVSMDARPRPKSLTQEAKEGVALSNSSDHIKSREVLSDTEDDDSSSSVIPHADASSEEGAMQTDDHWARFNFDMDNSVLSKDYLDSLERQAIAAAESLTNLISILRASAGEVINVLS